MSIQSGNLIALCDLVIVFSEQQKCMPERGVKEQSTKIPLYSKHPGITLSIYSADNGLSLMYSV